MAAPAPSDNGEGPKTFTQLIRQFTERKSDAHVLSGEHFSSLRDFLEDVPRSRYRYSAVRPESRPEFASIHLLVNKGPATQKRGGALGDPPTTPLFIVPVNAPDDLESILGRHLPSVNDSLIVFLSGWNTADSLRLLGARCGVEPELFRRHLDFLGEFLSCRRFDQPPLPSCQLGVWQVRTVTICIRKKPFRSDQVRRQRRTHAADVRKYLNNLRNQQLPGAPIIRRRAILNEEVSVIENQISFCVYNRSKGGWIGTAWLDNGRPFDLSSMNLPGETEDSANDECVPLVLHRPKIALSPPQPPPCHSNKSDPRGTGPEPEKPSVARACPTLSNLPSQYGSTLDPDIARVDAFYAFSELITLAACSENQFLNLIQEQIEIRLASYLGVEATTLEDLQYFGVLLQDLVKRAEEVMYLLENEHHTQWPAMRNGLKETNTRETTRKLLLDDYGYILRRGREAVLAVQRGISAITTSVMTRDAQRSMVQAREIGRVTLLAYFFLPLTLVTSIFGMNFVTFPNVGWGAGAVGIALLVVVPLAMILGIWDKMPWAKSAKRTGEQDGCY